MPIHDWTRVAYGTWHAFHLGWIAAMQSALNNGLLPAGYYALAEQVVRPVGPDVLLTAVGRPLIEMPLFLTPDEYVAMPFESTYEAGYRGMPRQIRDVLEA